MTSSEQLAVERRTFIENAIIDAIFEKAAKMNVVRYVVWNGGDEPEIDTPDGEAARNEMGTSDTDEVRFYIDAKKYAWVQFVYGNDGYDVLADHTVTSESIDLLKEADALSDAIAEDQAGWVVEQYQRQIAEAEEKRLALRDHLKTVVDSAKSAKHEYAESAEWTSSESHSCQTQRVPTALLNRIAEISEYL